MLSDLIESWGSNSCVVGEQICERERRRTLRGRYLVTRELNSDHFEQRLSATDCHSFTRTLRRRGRHRPPVYKRMAAGCSGDVSDSSGSSRLSATPAKGAPYLPAVDLQVSCEPGRSVAGQLPDRRIMNQPAAISVTRTTGILPRREGCVKLAIPALRDKLTDSDCLPVRPLPVIGTWFAITVSKAGSALNRREASEASWPGKLPVFGGAA